MFSQVFSFFAYGKGKSFSFLCLEGGGRWMQVKHALISQEKRASFFSLHFPALEKWANRRGSKKREWGERRKGWISALMKQERVNIAKTVANVVNVPSTLNSLNYNISNSSVAKKDAPTTTIATRRTTKLALDLFLSLTDDKPGLDPVTLFSLLLFRVCSA